MATRESFSKPGKWPAWLSGHTMSLELDPIAYGDLPELANYAYHCRNCGTHSSPNAVHPPHLRPALPSVILPTKEKAHPHSPLRTGSRTTETGSTKSSVEIMMQIIRKCAKTPTAMLIFPIHPKPAGASVLHHRRGIFGPNGAINAVREAKNLFAMPDA